MSKLEKAKARLLSLPKDYTYDEARSLLGQLGFREDNKGKTSGSRVEFFRESDKSGILLHKPHPDNVLEYKGYHTKVEFDVDSAVLRGEIEGIRDYVDFESESIDGIEQEFHDAVDEYLSFCERNGKKPEKEYKGSFNIRISPTLHWKLTNIASKNGVSLNATVEEALKQYASA